MRDELLRIKSNFTPPKSLAHTKLDIYFESMEALVKAAIPKSAFPDNVTIENSTEYFEKLHRMMPLITWGNLDAIDEYISVTCICQAYQTDGMGRFTSDLFSHWLIPGKQVGIVNIRSLNFHFVHYKDVDYFIHAMVLHVPDVKDHFSVKTNLPTIANDLKLNILSVQHIRQVVSIKPLTLDQKKILIQENISSLLNRSSEELTPCIYDIMNQLLIKASADKKINHIKDQLEPLVQLRPTAFNRDIFPEVQKYVSNLKDSFIALRDLKYLNRVISYHYILRKYLTNSLHIHPKKRHLSIKLLRSKLLMDKNPIPILGVIVGLNLVKENEVFESKHVLKALQSILPEVDKVQESSITEKYENNRVVTIYLEIKHPNKAAFKPNDIKLLRQKLPREIKNRIESVMNPVFVHRNEEEVMRNILDLSKQLKYIHDLPQVIVNFHKQTAFEISFLVILLRLVKPNERNLKELFQSSNTILKLYEHDVRMVGILRKRYPKEANVFEIRLDKKQFLRKDFSLDLHKARLCVVSEITRLIGDVRDYNGGMIAKQHEVLTELKALLTQSNIRNDFLLENFFYALTPNYMQSLLSPHILKELFLKLLSVLEHDFNKDIYYMQTKIYEEHYLLMLGALHPSFSRFISKLLDELLTSCHEFTHALVNVYDITCVGFLLKFDQADEYRLFEDHIIKALGSWKKEIESETEENTSFLNTSRLLP